METTKIYEENDDRRELLVFVAKMYYQQRKSQQEIADTIHASRSNVSRMLTQCVEQKIVEFFINDVTTENVELQRQLKKEFGLKSAIVVSSQMTGELTKRRLGEAVCSYLRRELRDGMTMGIAWGTTLYYMGSAFRPLEGRTVDVVQLVGGLGARSIDTDGGEITRRLALAAGGDAYLAQFPYRVQTKELKEMLLQEPEIRAHFVRAAKCDIAVVGMGASQKSLSSAIRAGYFSEKDMDILTREGSKADVCGNQIDSSGRQCAKTVSDRIMGISFEALKKIPLVLGMAVGAEKKEAIRSSLLSGLLDIAALDADAARAVLDK